MRLMDTLSCACCHQSMEFEGGHVGQDGKDYCDKCIVLMDAAHCLREYSATLKTVANSIGINELSKNGERIANKIELLHSLESDIRANATKWLFD